MTNAEAAVLPDWQRTASRTMKRRLGRAALVTLAAFAAYPDNAHARTAQAAQCIPAHQPPAMVRAERQIRNDFARHPRHKFNFESNYAFIWHPAGARRDAHCEVIAPVDEDVTIHGQEVQRHFGLLQLGRNRRSVVVVPVPEGAAKLDNPETEVYGGPVSPTYDPFVEFSGALQLDRQHRPSADLMRESGHRQRTEIGRTIEFSGGIVG